jgi:hypothetical protein
MDRFMDNDPQGLADYVSALEQGLVLFDGRPGDGKTYLASRTAKTIGARFVDADGFLEPKQDAVLSARRLDELRNSVEASLASSRMVLLAGVCARQIVERAKLPPAASYVWVEKISLTLLPSARALFADDLNRNEVTYPDGRRRPLYAEVEAYIATYNARSLADRVYFNAYEGS